MSNLNLKDYIAMAVGVVALTSAISPFFLLKPRVDRIEDQMSRLEEVIRQDEKIKNLRGDFEEFKQDTKRVQSAMWRRIGGE